MLLATGCRIAFDPSDRPGNTDAAPDGVVDPDAVPAGISVAQVTPLTSADSVNPHVVTFAAPTTTGNAIALLTWSWAAGSTSFPSAGATDSAGNIYGQLRTHVLGVCAGGGGGVAIYVAANITGMANHTVSLMMAGDALQQVALVAVEYRGLSVAPFLSASSAAPNGLSPLAIFSAPVVIAQPDTLILSVATVCGGYPDPVVWSNANGADARGVEPRTFELAPGIAGDRVVGAGTTEETWTAAFTGGTTVDAIGVIAAVR